MTPAPLTAAIIRACRELGVSLGMLMYHALDVGGERGKRMMMQAKESEAAADALCDALDAAEKEKP